MAGRACLGTMGFALAGGVGCGVTGRGAAGMVSLVVVCQGKTRQAGYGQTRSGEFWHGRQG